MLLFIVSRLRIEREASLLTKVSNGEGFSFFELEGGDWDACGRAHGGQGP